MGCEAALLGLHMDLVLRIQRLIVERESITVITSLQADLEDSLMEIKKCLEDYRNLFSRFETLEFNHVIRDYNKIVHSME